MKRTYVLSSVMMLLSLAVAAAPAMAQQARGRQDRSEGRAQQGEGRANEGRAVPRAERAAPRRSEGPRVVAPRGNERRFDPPRSVRVRPYDRSYYRPYYQPYYRPFSRPYYTFRPRWSIGFGLWSGYPVAYPYNYGSAYPYNYSSVYPYNYPVGVPGAVNVAPGVAAAGGLSFSIEPSTAEIYADGEYVGQSIDFSATSQPLTLAPGRHRIEVRAPGFESIVFDADVSAGQVLPYQGTLQPR